MGRPQARRFQAKGHHIGLQASRQTPSNKISVSSLQHVQLESHVSILLRGIEGQLCQIFRNLGIIPRLGSSGLSLRWRALISQSHHLRHLYLDPLLPTMSAPDLRTLPHLPNLRPSSVAYAMAHGLRSYCFRPRPLRDHLLRRPFGPPFGVSCLYAVSGSFREHIPRDRKHRPY
ncbi:hypothetical protein EDB86DRAFT_2927605 [Lactarius hatsudake]|nr:hypothetical protein EDB86DRAFT_2927605 [Lactarius hatsudake]